jgi:hypothetical protein
LAAGRRRLCWVGGLFCLIHRLRAITDGHRRPLGARRRNLAEMGRAGWDLYGLCMGRSSLTAGFGLGRAKCVRSRPRAPFTEWLRRHRASGGHREATGGKGIRHPARPPCHRRTRTGRPPSEAHAHDRRLSVEDGRAAKAQIKAGDVRADAASSLPLWVCVVASDGE